eukprot:gnl/MRDRNA2_/MRDRNA2_151092_c0_seq1.p1 gnl/MRDRNA2_/MRDRNA2_151092_c0~~gnl/MRDRNA2_/MRDRNA2_151092_c0_seq1.p1  ORF type:complete len:516 (+),score=63.58 gnl/MRDRNA2_/MRDRNA2_151092_c0_seq1:13-1560(+)
MNHMIRISSILLLSFAAHGYVSKLLMNHTNDMPWHSLDGVVDKIADQLIIRNQFMRSLHQVALDNVSLCKPGNLRPSLLSNPFIPDESLGLCMSRHLSLLRHSASPSRLPATADSADQQKMKFNSGHENLGRRSVMGAASLALVHQAKAAALTELDPELARALQPSGLDAELIDALAPVAENEAVGDAIRLPIELKDGSYVVDYMIGNTPVKGVLDTGSPFITMVGRCSKYWGCLQESDARLSGYEDTREIYGLQEDGVTKWVLGDVTLNGTRLPLPLQSATSSDANDPARFKFDECLFGVTSQVTVTGNAAPGPLLGLVKYRTPGIRPTFLGQTDISSFHLDFVKNELLLSRRGLIPPGTPGVLKMVDLRPLGAPVFHYAVEVQQLWVNQQPYSATKKIYAVFDSGTTGMLIDRDLYNRADFDMGAFECHMSFKAEDRSEVIVGTSIQTCAKDRIHRKECLFLCFPLDIPWEGVPKDAHIIFVGLAAMFNQGNITIDTNARTLKLGGYPGYNDI